MRSAKATKKLCVNPDWCKGCRYCIEFCPQKVLSLVEDKVTITKPDACIYCGQCEQRCPDYAIWLEEV